MEEGHIWVDREMSDTFHNEVSNSLHTPGNQEASEIMLHIQSPGGNVYAGYNAYHMLKLSGKKIKTRIEGEAQSMATFLSLAGDDIEIYNPSVYMIHFPQAGVQGTADAMESGASSLRNIENDMASAYHMKNQKSYAKDKSVIPLSLEQVKEMMRKETSLTAYQAKQYGFVDRVIDPLRAVAIGKTKTNMENKTGIKKAFEDFKAQMNALVEGILPAAEVPAAPAPTPAPAAPVKAVALPAGEYPMQDGSVIVVDETGMIIEVKPAAPSEPMPTEDQKMIQALQTELATVKASAEESEKKATSAVTALGTIKTEFEVLRKKTVGDDSAPKAAATFTKEPSALGDDNDAAMRDEIFEIGGLNWIKNIKRN